MSTYPFLKNLPKITGRYVVVDTETTGLSVKKENIIELACIELIDGHVTGKQFHIYLRPRTKISFAAEKVHKMSSNFYDELYKDVYKSDKNAMMHFLEFVGDSLIFAHNALFDMRFINKELVYWGLTPITENKFRCSVQIFRKLFPYAKSASLLNCCEYFGFNITSDRLHSAIYDTFCTARVILKLFEQEEKEKDKENLFKIEKKQEKIKDDSKGNCLMDKFLDNDKNKPQPLVEKKIDNDDNKKPIDINIASKNNDHSKLILNESAAPNESGKESEKIKIDQEDEHISKPIPKAETETEAETEAKTNQEEIIDIDLGKYDPIHLLTPKLNTISIVDDKERIISSQKDIMRKYLDSYQKTKNKERSIEITNKDCGPNSIDKVIADEWDGILNDLDDLVDIDDLV